MRRDLAALLLLGASLAGCQTAQSPAPAIDKAPRPTVNVWVTPGIGGDLPQWLTVQIDAHTDGWWWSVTPVDARAGDADQTSEPSGTLELSP